MLIKARTTGMFFSKGDSLKCRSISLAPLKNSSKFLYPIQIEIIKPTEPHKENLPPTHSGMERIFLDSIPNSLGS